MLEFIKMFGLGILYTILFPFILVFFALVLVFMLLNYLVMETVNCVGFFFGHTFTVETELDKELKRMKEERNKEVESEKVLVKSEANLIEEPSLENEGGDLL